MGDNIYRDVDLLNFSAENELQKPGLEIVFFDFNDPLRSEMRHFWSIIDFHKGFWAPVGFKALMKTDPLRPQMRHPWSIFIRAFERR